ncbi:MAG TPA: hypothetical protein VKA19_07260, partial [Alphaproteobacteria bacterium]|nr:hypothetical protein [Alphaproteobacteria bacterium]
MYTTESGDNAAPEQAEPSVARQRLAKKWVKRVLASKEHFKKDFERIQENTRLARTGGTKDQIKAKHYIANLIQNFVRHKVAELYAKNPRVVAERRRRLDYKIWDGREESLQDALTQIQGATQQGVDPAQAAPQAAALIADIVQAQQQQRMYDKLGKTLEILLEYFMDAGALTFKKRLKKLVRKTIVCGVGYVKLGYQRTMRSDPDIEQKLDDATERLQHMQRLKDEQSESEIMPDDAEAEELRLMIADLQQRKEVVLREGLTFTFLQARQVIPDTEVTQLNGFIDARWIAVEHILPCEKVEEYYGVDLKGKKYTAYRSNGEKEANNGSSGESNGEKTTYCAIYDIQDKESGLVYVVADGYDDFLQEPKEPDVYISTFWDIFALTFNEVENEDDEDADGKRRVFPLADVENLAPIQEAYNSNRQGVREHRARNRPGFVGVKGRLDNEDKDKLTSNTVNAYIELNSMKDGEDVRKLIQAKPTAPLDPNMYQVEELFTDFQRVGGLMDANLGNTGGATATENSIGENSRMTVAAANTDDLDEFLSDIARAAGEIMLSTMDPEAVTKIVGPG